MVPPQPAPPQIWLQKHEALVTAGICALLCGLIYGHSLGFGFAYDDGYRIERLPAMAATFPKPLLAPRGLTYLFHFIDFRIWGENPLGYHLTNLILHWSACLCAGLAAHRLSRRPLVGLWCGVLFAVHPVHVEAVVSFVNRKDILAFIFCALAVITWLEEGKPRRRLLTPLLLFMALWAKEAAAIGLVLMLPLLDLLRPTTRLSLKQRLPVWVPLAVSLAAIPFLIPHVLSLFWKESIIQLTAARLESPFRVFMAWLNGIPLQLELLLWPYRPAAEYNIPSSAAGSGTLLSFLIIGAIVVAVLFLWKRNPIACFALLWTVIMWAPVSNLIPITPFFAADRYLYTPSFGICLLAALVGAGGCGTGLKGKSLQLLMCALVLFAGFWAYGQTKVWRNDQTLWQAALERGWDTHRARSICGTLAYLQNDFPTAITHLEAALSKVPADIETRIKLMIAYSKSERRTRAVGQAQLVLNAFPNYAEAHRIMAMDHLIKSNYETAADHFRIFLRTNPHRNDALNNLAWILATAPGDEGVKEAVSASQRACRQTQNTNPAYLYTHAMALARSGNFPKALAQLDLADKLADGTSLQTQIQNARRSFQNKQPLATRRK